ncbi:MAG: 2-oxoglutarate dehydrogenase complex dihydrolipoyllysine-residue succinyltransferase, partial [Pseudomonadota bacterium]|nr:2-oxoglutarate dehydrogenase complex dihydrolipoyllysine-residue succinyltransferase [Pseudomonadota bacterium]
MTEILVPTLGESVSEATVATWLKKEGEAVKADEPIVELETDKVTLEVNAPSDGVIVKISAAEGENVEVGALLGEIDANAAANDTKPAAAEKTAEASAPATDDDASGHKLSPAVKKMVDEHSLDPSKITGTGKDGRLIKEDVQNFLDKQGKAAETPAPQAVSVPPAPQREAGEREERVRMTRLRQSIAKRLKEAQNTAAMLTTFNEVDMTAVMEMRKQYKDVFEKKHGTKLGFMSFFVKACVNALNEFPAVNAEIQGDEIVYKNYCDIGVAVSTPQGLVVPVLRGCEDRNMANIESSIVELGTKAREGKISIDDMTGGSFTITNGGVFGSLMSTPILNAPQSGILGMHKIQQRPMVMADGSIEA